MRPEPDHCILKTVWLKLCFSILPVSPVPSDTWHTLGVYLPFHKLYCERLVLCILERKPRQSNFRTHLHSDHRSAARSWILCSLVMIFSPRAFKSE